MIPGLSSPRATSLPESVTALRSFLRIASGSSSTYTIPCPVDSVVDIFRVGSCRSMIRAPTAGNAVVGHPQHFLAAAEAGVEAPGQVAHQLQVLALVLAHRDLVGAVGEHVGGLQHRIQQQPGRHQLALGRALFAELVHPLQPSELGQRAQQPRQLRVLGDVALAEQDAAGGVEPGRQQDRGRVVGALAQLGGS